jgi:hypothetical protein
MIKLALGVLLMIGVSLALFGLYMLLDRLVKLSRDVSKDAWLIYVWVCLCSFGGVVAYFTIKAIGTQ